MSIRLRVESFVVEGATQEDVAAKVARHFGCIADGHVPDSGLAIAHITEEE